MAIVVKCLVDDKVLVTIDKGAVTEDDLKLYEKSCKCSEHGGNTYVYDQIEILDENGLSFDPPQYEQGELISSTIIIKAEVV